MIFLLIFIGQNQNKRNAMKTKLWTAVLIIGGVLTMNVQFY